MMLMDLRDRVGRVHLEEIEDAMAGYMLTPNDDAFVRRHDMFHTDLFGNALDHFGPWHEDGILSVMDFSAFSEDPEYYYEVYFPYVDYAFMSYDGDDMGHLRSWIRHVWEMGLCIVTATMGERGSLSYNGERYSEGGILVPPRVVNTVGAGDSYIVGFTYGLIKRWDMPLCQRKGAELSSEVISKFDPY